jgi:hypothetical protein
MNNPEYILVDELQEVVSKVKTELKLPVLNYQYGYVEVLNETLEQWSKSKDHAALKFPLVWVMQPFVIARGERGFYGSVEGLKIFIINNSEKTLKAPDRMAKNFKPIIYPIYRELMNQINRHNAFESSYSRKHKFTDRYYWGEQQQSVLNDVVDCSEIAVLELKIKDNQNCKTKNT